jgi:hypothetical protein
MTIERPDLRRDNHDLLRKVQEVWQVIEEGSMMPKVKVVSPLPSYSLVTDSSSPLQERPTEEREREREEKRREDKRREERDTNNRKNPRQPPPSVLKSVNSNQKLARKTQN